MISSGLKVGDTFTDGGFTYEIKEVLEGRYISKRVAVVVKPEKKEVKPATRSRKK